MREFKFKSITKKEAMKRFNKGQEVYVCFPNGSIEPLQHQEAFNLLSREDGIHYAQRIK